MENKRLNMEECVKLLGDFVILKAKGFSQNSVFDSHKVAIFLLASYDFKSLREIKVFLSKACKLGIISARNLVAIIDFLEYQFKRNGYFEPNMEDKLYVDYFFSLTKRLKSSSIKQKAMIVNLFLKYLQSQGIQAKNLKDISMKFLHNKTLPNFLNDHQYKAFLQHAIKMEEYNIFQIKRKLAIFLVYYTGIRSREVSRLKLEDIRNDGLVYVFRINGKCARERFVSIKKEHIGTLLEKYIALREELQCKSQYLFQLRNTNEAPRTCYSLKPLLKKIDSVQSRGNCLHLLRHSYASFIYRSLKDIVLTSQMLGHTNINTTQIYIHINPDTHEKVAELF